MDKEFLLDDHFESGVSEDGESYNKLGLKEDNEDFNIISEYSIRRNIQKSNILVFDARFDFSAIEQDVANYITTVVKAPFEDYDMKEVTYKTDYEFTLEDLCLSIGKRKNGQNYKALIDALVALRDKEVYIDSIDSKDSKHNIQESLTWLSNLKVNKGNVNITVSDSIFKLISELSVNFLSYPQEYSYVLRGKYSKRIYEMLKAYINRASSKINKQHKSEHAVEYRISIDKMKECLMIQDVKSYNNVTIFKNNVIIPPVREINKMTDLKVKVRLEKTKSRFDKVAFRINYKADEELCEIKKIINKKMTDNYNTIINTKNNFEWEIY